MSQLSIPVEISLRELTRKASLGAAIDLCADAAGLQSKQICDALKIDKASWSRWVSGGEGVSYPKLAALMDHCGNNAPVLWMAHDRGYELSSMHLRETELQRELRLAREENGALRRVIKALA